MPETIINLCDFDVVLYRPDHPEVLFPAKVDAPVAAVLAAMLPQRDTRISRIHWSEINPRVLPPQQEGVFYIVPLEFGIASHREDLLVPFRGQFEARDGAFAHRMNTRALVKVKDALPPRHSLLALDLDEVLGS